MAERMTGSPDRRLWPVAAGGMLWLAVALPPAARILEASMLGHQLVQIPSLAASGYLLGLALRPHETGFAAPSRAGRAGEWNPGGLPGLLLAVFAAAFWMLPRSLDTALANPLLELAKIIALPALVGLPLALSWQRLAPLLRAFIGANLISMLVVLGWLYTVSPFRLCNAYWLDQQEDLGRGCLVFAGLLACFWIARFVFRRAQKAPAAIPLARAAEIWRNAP